MGGTLEVHIETITLSSLRVDAILLLLLININLFSEQLPHEVAEQCFGVFSTSGGNAYICISILTLL